jgi:hypothetical protein
MPQTGYTDKAWGGILKMGIPLSYVVPSAVREGYDPVKRQSILWIDLATQTSPTMDAAHPIAVAHFKNYGWWVDGPCTAVFQMSAAFDDTRPATYDGPTGSSLPSTPPDSNWVDTAQAVGHSLHSGDCD